MKIDLYEKNDVRKYTHNIMLGTIMRKLNNDKLSNVERQIMGQELVHRAQATQFDIRGVLDAKQVPVSARTAQLDKPITTPDEAKEFFNKKINSVAQATKYINDLKTMFSRMGWDVDQMMSIMAKNEDEIRHALEMYDIEDGEEWYQMTLYVYEHENYGYIGENKKLARKMVKLEDALEAQPLIMSNQWGI